MSEKGPSVEANGEGDLFARANVRHKKIHTLVYDSCCGKKKHRQKGKKSHGGRSRDTTNMSVTLRTSDFFIRKGLFQPADMLIFTLNWLKSVSAFITLQNGHFF